MNKGQRSRGGKLIRYCRAVVSFALCAELLAADPTLGDTNTPVDQAPGIAAPAALPASKPPLDGAEVAQTPALWPKEVTLLQAVPFPVVFAGRQAGETVVPAGTRLRVIQVLAQKVELESMGARQWVADSSTDLLPRAMRIRDAAALATQAAAGTPASAPATTIAPESVIDYSVRAREVSDEIQRDFWNPQTGLYSDKPGDKSLAVVWADGVMFSALAAAARHEPGQYGPVLKKFFKALDAYWDGKQPLGGYEPLPAGGDGHDKYYDDNEWLAIGFLEAYAVTGDREYVQRAAETVKFVLNGWDETYLHGGIWWHETHEVKVRCKNTCANAPAAVACLKLARISPPTEARALIGTAQKIVEWTVTNLQLPTALFADSRQIDDAGMNQASLTYNSALMIRAFLGLYRLSGKPADLQNAQHIAVAADALLSPKTGVYRDAKKWSHLLVEADLALYRTTKEPYLLERARRNADGYYEEWKADGPVDLITAASIARVLWLMADTQTPAGRAFWQQEDLPGAR